MAIVGFLAKLFVAAVLLSAALASAQLYGVMHPLTLGLGAIGVDATIAVSSYSYVLFPPKKR